MSTLHFSSSSSVFLHNSIHLCSSPSTVLSPKSNSTSSKKHINKVSAIYVTSSTSSINHKLELSKWRTRVSFFPSFFAGTKDAETLKKELLEAIAPLDRGAIATPDDQQRVEEIARELEAINKVKEPLKSSLLNEKWELLYITSRSILQNEATANLIPLSAKRVAVKFDAFKIAALIPIKSRGSGRGQLEITYLDEELRISRGNQGNLFVLKMVDPNYRVPL